MKHILSIPDFIKPLGFILALLVTVPTQAYFMNPATGFTGVGYDPDWHLEIVFSKNTMTLKTDGGEVKHRYNKLGPTLKRGEKTTIYRMHSRNHIMNVVVADRFCQDVRSGKAYSATVTIRVDDKTYVGCGMEVVPPFDD